MGTEAGGVPEILQHGECGFLFPPKDSKALAESLCYVLENKDERNNEDDALNEW